MRHTLLPFAVAMAGEGECGVQQSEMVRPLPQRVSWHVRETLVLAGPLAVAQLAQMAMGVTDTVLLGGLGGDALAAGGLAASIFITVVILLQGVVTAVSILVAQALGAGRERDVPRLYWAGMALTWVLMIPAALVFVEAGPILLWLHEPPALARDTGAYLARLAWGVPGALLGLGLMRAILPAIGQGSDLLIVALVAAVVNGLLCYGLIHGVAGLPALGMLGAATSTAIVLTLIAVALLALLHGRARLRRFVQWQRPGGRELKDLMRLGVPVAGTFAVETGLFLAVGLMVGLLGAAALAAQQVAMSAVSVSFMVPLAIAQAANVRVGNAVGAQDWGRARRAGIVAIALGGVFELLTAVFVWFAPGTVSGWYVSPADTETTGIALSLLGVAALFQVVDGVQCVAGGALRGLGDTRVPFVIAAAGYWGVGFPLAWALTWWAGWGAVGAWWGLAASLLMVAALLTWRFLARTRQSAENYPRARSL